MESIYKDIAQRTGGNIYVGVVGPVRSGKSTLIKRFMEEIILPGIEDAGERQRATDELPQSASGRTVMTTEPKFIPENAVKVMTDDKSSFMMKLVDCVGYVVDGAEGLEENGQPRMVMTPWSDNALPFEQAAEIGTRKVIKEHATIGLMVTTDGSFGEIGRDAYVPAEERIIRELDLAGKPYAVILNSSHPDSEDTQDIARQMTAKFSRPVIAANCFLMDEKKIKEILCAVLGEFYVKELSFEIPGWLLGLPKTDQTRSAVEDALTAAAGEITKMKDLSSGITAECREIERITTVSLDYGTGKASARVEPDRGLFYRLLGEKSGVPITGEAQLMEVMKELGDIRTKYQKISEALKTARNTGYGIVVPTTEDITLEDPEVTKQPSGYGIKFKASAPSIHMIRANIKTELNPVIGSEKQSEDMATFILDKIDKEPQKVWELNMFGKSLNDMMNDELSAKLEKMPEESRAKFVDMLQKVINEGSGGLICIIL